MATKSPKPQRTTVVTGASLWIGKAGALLMTRAGDRVIGTSRTGTPGEIPDGIRMITCDVPVTPRCRARETGGSAGHAHRILNIKSIPGLIPAHSAPITRPAESQLPS